MNRSQIVLSVIVILAVALAGYAPAAALTELETESLAQAGLTSGTLADLTALHQAPSGRRSPSVTSDEAGRLVQAGFTDDFVRLFIRLDRLTLNRETPLITPAQALELKAAGVGPDTLRLMLTSEIDRIERGGAGTGMDRMGREVVDQPDGSQIIIYRSGDPNAPIMDSTRRQEEDLRRAWELLRNIQINIKR